MPDEKDEKTNEIKNEWDIIKSDLRYDLIRATLIDFINIIKNSII